VSLIHIPVEKHTNIREAVPIIGVSLGAIPDDTIVIERQNTQVRITIVSFFILVIRKKDKKL
jgi:hypothetical protein